MTCSQHSNHTAGCEACRRGARLYWNRRQQAIAAGTWLPAVDAAAARAHLIDLRDDGMTAVAMAADSGIPVATIRNVLTGRVGLVQGHTAAGILAIEYRPSPRAGHVCAVGPRRRVQALCAAGYTLADQARRMNRPDDKLWELANGKSGWIRREHAEKIAALYDELAMLPGPSKYARTTARGNGWVPPLAWDDDEIDDPAAGPARVDHRRRADAADPAKVEAALAGRLKRTDLNMAERIEAVSRLAAAGMSDRQIAVRLRWSRKPENGLDAVAQFRGRHGIPPAIPSGRAA